MTEARFDGDKSGPISKKALHMAGPEADRSRRDTPFCVAQKHPPKGGWTGPLYLVASGGSGTPLDVPDGVGNGRT
ncbi:Uncharacterised protein [Mycobacteroides abscessus subsp. abscessus]|nr:Uncharacterised protein [Mycobacteroides abscessus subsp. abscessus]